jgi:hypothetical protein
MKKTIFLLIAFAYFSCAPKVKSKISVLHEPLSYNETVVLLEKNQPLPDGAQKIGTVRVGDSGFSVDCGWDVAIEHARVEARAAGGNALRIIKHTKPNGGSTCDRITAEIYKLDSNIVQKLMEEQTTVVDSKLYIYRESGQGALVGFNLYLGDSLLCRVKNNSKHEIKVKQAGNLKLSAATESEYSLPILIEPGKEYYIRCLVTMGAFVGRPKMYLIDRPIGKAEYKAIRDRNS